MIPGLDGLRAIAILLVFAYHGDLIEFGWAGVQLFFVLSGFLITGILLDMKEALPSGDYFVKFYGRRLLRIFPLYYFYLGLMIVLAYWLRSIDFRPNNMQIYLNQVWYAIFYIYDFFYRAPWFQPSQFLDHFWTLSVEEQFYVVWPLILLLVPGRHFKKLFIAFIVLAAMFRFGMYLLYLSGSSLWSFREPFEMVIYSWPLSHLDAFALGAYISRYSVPFPRRQLLLFTFLVPAIGYLATYISTGNLGLISALGYDLPLSVGYQFIWAPALLNYFFALLIYGVAREGIFVGILSQPWLRYIGKISYGIYVYHFPVLWFVKRFLEGRMPEEMTFWANLVISFSVTILIATLSYYALERPFLNLKSRLFPWSRLPADKIPK